MTTINHSQSLRITDYKPAVLTGHKQMFERLLEAKINPNKKSNNITHPIFLTIIHDRPDYCKQLFNKFKISPTLRDMTTAEHKTILHTIFDKITSNTPIFLEIFDKHLPLLINLTDTIGHSPVVYLYESARYILTEAEKESYWTTLNLILNLPNINYNKLGKNGWTPLVYLVKLFLNKNIQTDIFIKTFKITLDTIKSKIGTERRDNFNPNLIIETNDGILLNYLIQTEIKEVIELFLEFPNVDPGNTAMRKHGKKSAISLVCRNLFRADATEKQNTYYTDILTTLVSHPRINTFNLEDSHGQTPLKRAIDSKNIKKISFILQTALQYKLELNLDPIYNLLMHDSARPETLEDAYDFFQDSQIDKIMDLFDLNFHPPIPPDRLHLVFLEKVNQSMTDQLWLTEKADGIYKNSLPKTVYPELHTKIKGEFKIEAEWIDHLDLYLVFNIVTPEISHLNYWERMAWLRNLHPVAKNTDENPTRLYSLTDFAYKLENEDLLKFLEDSATDQTIGQKWWPKLVFKTNSFFSFLSRQKILTDEYEYHNGVYSNDGIIVVPELQNQRLQKKLGIIAKIKPKIYQTLDLQWVRRNEESNNLVIDEFVTREGHIVDNILLSNRLEYKKGVWRCYWNSEAKSWIPKDHRPEKKQANPIEILRTLERDHKCPITLEDLKYISRLSPYYSLEKTESLGIEEITFLQTQKEAQIQFFNVVIPITTPIASESLTDNSLNWLDIGFGNTARKENNIWSLFPNKTRWSGIDLDPISVYTARRFYPDGRWVCGNFCNDLEKYYKKTTYNGIITINSAHFAAKSEKLWSNFRSQIDNITAPGAFWIMVFLDADLLNELIAENKDDRLNFSGGYLERLKHYNKANITASSILTLNMKYHYSWAQSQGVEIYESVISYERFKKSLSPGDEMLKWKIIESKTAEEVLNPSHVEKTNKLMGNEHTPIVHKNLLKYQRCFRYILLQKQ